MGSKREGQMRHTKERGDSGKNSERKRERERESDSGCARARD